MKIADVRTYVLQTPLDRSFAFSQGWVTKRSATLVEVVTEGGLSGWGEAFNQGLEPPQISAAAIEHALKPLVVGSNPLDTEVLWQRMYAATRDYGRKGSVMAAISAVDIALWDLAGQILQQPIYQLLGGAFRRRVQAYATGFYRLEGTGEAERLGTEALAHYEAGFTAMKVKLGFGVDDDLAVMRAVHRALGERPIKLMIDANHAYNVSEARRLGLALEPLGIAWFEEPVAPEDHAGYRELRAALSIPIAGGENEHSVYGFRDLLAAGCVDIAQPDIASAGGFTACRQIVTLAQAYGIAVNPHVWGSAVAQAASLQLIAAIPPAAARLFPAEPLFEYDRSAHPLRNAIVRQALDHRNGWVEIPGRAGLGVEIDRENIKRFCVS